VIIPIWIVLGTVSGATWEWAGRPSDAGEHCPARSGSQAAAFSTPPPSGRHGACVAGCLPWRHDDPS
jgi:hypothetical protein